MRRSDKETPVPPKMVLVPSNPDGLAVLLGCYIGCPRCERKLSVGFEYCPRCGQHIKWERKDGDGD